MSEMSERVRKERRAKAEALCSTSTGKIDASDYGPIPTDLGSDRQVQAKRPARSKYKRGGKVAEMHGEAKEHKGKKPRKRDAGGEVPSQRFGFSGAAPGEMAHAAGLKDGGDAPQPIGYHIVNKKGEIVGKAKNLNRARNMLDKHDNDYGGYQHAVKPVYDRYAKGGAAHKDEAEDKKLIKKEVKKSALKEHLGGEALGLKRAPKKLGGKLEHKKAHHPEGCRCEMCSGGMNVADGALEGTRPEPGGRMARKEGGRAKKKGAMNVNIVIATGKGAQPGMPQGAPMPPPGAPPGGMPAAGLAPPPMPTALGGGQGAAPPPQLVGMAGGAPNSGGPGMMPPRPGMMPPR